MPRRLGADSFRAFGLTLAGSHSAVLAVGFPSLGIGFVGAGHRIRTYVLTAAFKAGRISGSVGAPVIEKKAGKGRDGGTG